MLMEEKTYVNLLCEKTVILKLRVLINAEIGTSSNPEDNLCYNTKKTSDLEVSKSLTSVVVGNFWKTSVLVGVTDIKTGPIIPKRMKEFCTGRDQVVLFNQQTTSGHTYCNTQQSNYHRVVTECL